MRTIVQCVVGMLLASLVVADSWAETESSTPVYNPETKSYFQLVAFGKGYARDSSIGANWEAARQLAESRTFKGVRGRLAVVKSRAVSNFLRDTFHPDMPAWIGLRYWCKFRVLQWVTGESLGRTDYENWDIIWNRAGAKRGSAQRAWCGSQSDFYLPVHFWPVQSGFRWNANGMIKAFPLLFIEYPVGGE